MNFGKFAKTVENQFNGMAKGKLYRVELSKDEAWEAYMAAFPEGTNEIYKERIEYDCQTCKNFIRNIANVVAIVDGKMVSVWDVKADGYYNDVAEAMSKLVKSKDIQSIFLVSEPKFGAPHTVQVLDDGATLTWNHFSCVVPQNFVKPNDLGRLIGLSSSQFGVFKRGLDEISPEAVEIVLDLIASNSIYRGEEFKKNVTEFRNLQKEYSKLKSEKKKKLFVWSNLDNGYGLIRNSVIGTLLTDISDGVTLENAVKSFEDKVAPTNYKRTTALVTKGMIKKAMETINKLGIEPSLHRRMASIEDITVNNVLFADKSAAKVMKGGVEELLMGSVVETPKKFDKVEEVSVDKFVSDILPRAESLEVLVTNKHTPNFVTLTAPVYDNAPNLFKWGNAFAWSYNGNIADSGMKERVKAAGGKVDGVLRFSIQWNEEHKDKNNDLDAHCTSPKSHIYFSQRRGSCGGVLDVDITAPRMVTAVENITWQDLSTMPDGEYKFYVRNYSVHNTKGFRAEIEMNGEVFTYDYPSSVGCGRNVTVATVTLKNGEFTIKHSLKSTTSSQKVYGVDTETFVKVKTMMFSPNHWDGEETGNRHYFFMLEGCKTDEEVRGIYNEFLKPELNEHRKVFELLGSKMMCEPTDTQLSGVGFSTTKRNELVVKVGGATSRMVKVLF